MTLTQYILSGILLVLVLLLLQGKKMTQIVDDLVAEVTAHENVVDSIMVLLGKIHDMLVSATDNQDTSALKNVIAMLKSKDAVLAAAVVANTPADPNIGSPAVASADGSGTVTPGPVATGTGITNTDTGLNGGVPGDTASTGKTGDVPPAA